MRGACKGKKIGFIVQYGFSEALHARPLEKYLEKLSASLGCEYLGTIIKGGCDGLTKHPEGFKKLLNQIQRIGNIFGSAGGFDKALLADFARPERQTFLSAIFMRLFVKLANRLYWNPQLKANNALDKAYARPYTR